MISVGQRVQEAIDHLDRGRLAFAVAPTCLAFDVTARRSYGARRSSPALTGRFVREHLWLIAFMGLPRSVSTTARIPFSHPGARPDAAGTISLEDAICHVVRSSLARLDDRSARITWTGEPALCLDPSGCLVLPPDLLWGLIGAVVFTPANKNEVLPENYWLKIADFRMFISELWGRIDLARRIVAFYTRSSVP